MEVESVMMTHPAILEVAVIAMPDPKWQEVPCAFVTLKPDYVEATTVIENGLNSDHKVCVSLLCDVFYVTY